MRRKAYCAGLNAFTLGVGTKAKTGLQPIMQTIMRTLSIIIPMRNEAAEISATLSALAPLRKNGAQVIVVDGGSTDTSATLAAPLADVVLHSAPGRARQMNCGAAAANGEVLLFLHADTRLPEHADQLILHGLKMSSPPLSSPPRTEATAADWGRFDVQIQGQSRVLKIVAAMINWRSRTFGIATGDQAIFIRRSLFHAIGGFPQQALMEDIEICTRLKKHSLPLCLRQQVQTSGRRWDTRGVWRTIFLMWRLRFLYWIGVPADKIAKAYR